MDNVRIERHLGELKNRTKIMRGLGNDKSAQTYMDIHRINHNFVKPHMALNGKTPVEVCGITIEGKNKWMTIIQKASKGR